MIPIVKTYQEVLNETDFSKFNSTELEVIGRSYVTEILHSFSMINYHKKGLVVFDYQVVEQHNILRFGGLLLAGITDKESLEDKIFYMDTLKDFIIYVGTLNYKSTKSVKKKFIDSIKRITNNNNLKKRY